MIIEIGMKCKQIKAIEEYAFDYTGEEFEITKATHGVVMGSGLKRGIVFGIETEHFANYFEMIIEEEKESTQEVYVNEDGNKIIRNGNVTIVILEDGCKGVSKCLPSDKYDKTKGYDIAITKAKIKSLSKRLKVLTK